MEIVTGHGQVIQEQNREAKPFTLRIRDAQGHPMANVPIRWSVSPPTAGTLNVTTAQTNAQGEASTGFFASSNQPGESFRSATITATSSAGVLDFGFVI